MFKLVALATLSAIAFLPLAANSAEAPKAKVVLSEKQMDKVTAGGWDSNFGSFVGSVFASAAGCGVCNFSSSSSHSP